MSKSVFTRTNEHVKSVKRNTWDLSFQNNLTMDFGKLYPVFCKEVLPGDSFKIDPVFGLNFMPMYFPVQTRMRANMHFFYVRNRNLWSDYMDFVGNTKPNLVVPFIDTASEKSFKNTCATGELGDMLGVPTTIVGGYGGKYSNAFKGYVGDAELPSLTINLSSSVSASTIGDLLKSKNINSFVSSDVNPVGVTLAATPWRALTCKLDVIPSRVSGGQFVMDFGLVGQPAIVTATWKGCLYAAYVSKDGVVLGGNICSDVNNVDGTSYASFYDASISNDILEKTSSITLFIKADNYSSLFNPAVGGFVNHTVGPLNYTSSSTVPVVQDITPANSPYYSSINPKKDKQIKLSALSFRAYESIYNAFYRDIRNNPYLINGVPEYNRYLPSLDGGADKNEYTLRYRNWEQDFLTSAVQSPQQGVAPLVGIIGANGLGFVDTDGTAYSATLDISDDGETVTGVNVSAASQAVNANRSLLDVVTSGISISDFRNVNALQLWLEANNRIGLRYKDQVKAHYDVNIRFDELQMPEFIGGTSEDVSVNQINQQVDSIDMPLGSYAGQASCYGSSKNSISHYCDEGGFIIGILSVSPVPNYSQLLPKHFLKSSNLDTFYPEFGHISMQPILYNEVCPVQAYNSNPDELKQTFGYQRAWYEYLSSVDEVHGLFRTNLRNFLINRVFNTKPTLSPDFLLVDPKQVNDIFSVTTDSDKILGQVYFKCSCKRPIPLYGTPRLEA